MRTKFDDIPGWLLCGLTLVALVIYVARSFHPW